MKNLKHYISTKTYVFRQWSRRSYAVFNSLHRHVVVGCLGFDVYRSFYKKQTESTQEQLEMADLQSVLQSVKQCLLGVSQTPFLADAMPFSNINTTTKLKAVFKG